MKVGVLALQGAFAKHAQALTRCGTQVREVRLPEQLADLAALVLPGGESTTIGQLMAAYGFLPALREFARERPLFGTCAGLILLARTITAGEPDQPRLGLMDVVVERNAYGRQVDSFESDLDVPTLGPAPLRGVFIRAPRVSAVHNGVEVLASHEGAPVLVRQGRLLGASFHPELTDDLRLHRYFLSLAG